MDFDPFLIDYLPTTLPHTLKEQKASIFLEKQIFNGK